MPARRSVSEKISIRMITLIDLFLLIAMEAKLQNQKENQKIATSQLTNPANRRTKNKGPTMNPLTQFKRIRILPLLIAVTLVIGRASAGHATDLSATPVIDWSNEARRAIVPPSAGPENYGNKFPGEAALYTGIVHVAIYDSAVASQGRSAASAITPHAPP